MAVLRCKMCGGELKRRKGRTFECLYCGMVQTFDDLPIDFKYEDVEMSPAAQYEYACELMGENSIYFLQQAADVFDSLSGFLDAQNKRQECLQVIRKLQAEIERKNAEIQRKEKESRRKKRIRFWIVVVCCIVVILLIIGIPKATHSEQKIEIEIVDVWGKSDNRYYFVYMDYQIDNNTGATIDYVEVTTYFSDKSGKNLGTVTSSFGSAYGNTALNLKPHETVIKETYLSEYKSSDLDVFFIMLYNDGTDDLIITYEITYVKWSDGYTYNR